MINLKIISRIIGQLLFIEAAMMFLCFGLALLYEEDDALPFLISTFVTIIIGLFLHMKGRNARNSLNRRDAFLVVTLVWIAFSVTGMLPYLVSGYIRNVTDAFFETMSGFTTTGCTILSDVEILPHAMLFWRALTQFLGGLGIVFFTIALLPSLVGGSVKIYSAESTGPVNSKLHPRLSTTAKWIWTIYIVLTISCILSFKIAGMEWFDSICYALSTTATGGFSVHNNGVFVFNKDVIEYIAVFFQFLSGVNFSLIYLLVFKGRLGMVLKSSELKFYTFVVLVATVSIMLLLINDLDYSFGHALRASLFQVVSFVTTTGLFSENVGQWPHITWIILGLLMFCGACSGSTSGGFKCIRCVMLLKVVINEFKQKLHPRAVLPVRINGENVERRTYSNLLAYFALFIAFIVITSMIMIGAGVDHTNALMMAMSCVSNVGPSLGSLAHPEVTWGTLSVGLKWVCSALMLVGRLEIFTVLVLFTPSFWKDS